jgi:hypothetical protein
MASTTTSRYCQCGGAAVVSSSPPDLAEGVAAKFDEWHTREGCGPATARQARAARAKAEQQLVADHG